MPEDAQTKQKLVFGHHKCATNWLRRILRLVAKYDRHSLSVLQGQPEHVRGDLGEIVLYVNASGSEQRLRMPAQKSVHVIRDPRDAVISQYWSWKISHKNNDERILAAREYLQGVGVVEGLSFMVDNLLMAEQLEDWDFSEFDCPESLVVTYERMSEDFPHTLRSFLSHLDLPRSVSCAQKIAKKTSFEALAGHARGVEDRNKHLRKGLPGEWKSVFTAELKRRFADRHQILLEQLRYESDTAWVAR